MKWKATLVIMTAFYFLAAGDGIHEIALPYRAMASEPASGQWNVSFVDKLVAAWQPTQAERAFDEIAWAKDLTEAEGLAKTHGRPIFLFTYDGSDLACFRC